MADDETSVWIKTEPSVDGTTYVVTLEASNDIAVTLTPDHALRYAAGVLAVAHRAAYDAAIGRQLTRKLGMALKVAAHLISDMREDRPPLDPKATEPLLLEPGVNLELVPFVSVRLNGEHLGQWTVQQAQEHAMFALEAVAVADLDSAYYRMLRGQIGTEEFRARNVVNDLRNWRPPPDAE